MSPTWADTLSVPTNATIAKTDAATISAPAPTAIARGSSNDVRASTLAEGGNGRNCPDQQGNGEECDAITDWAMILVRGCPNPGATGRSSADRIGLGGRASTRPYPGLVVCPEVPGSFPP